MTRPQLKETAKALRWVSRGKGTMTEAAKKFGLHRSTLYRALERAKK